MKVNIVGIIVTIVMPYAETSYGDSGGNSDGESDSSTESSRVVRYNDCEYYGIVRVKLIAVAGNILRDDSSEGNKIMKVRILLDSEDDRIVI